MIIISIKEQVLYYLDNHNVCQAKYNISSAKNGIGQIDSSYCTPVGMHQVSEKIGDKLPVNAVFQHRKFTNEIYSPRLQQQYPKKDWILSRIIRLSGVEDGFNLGINDKGMSVDTYNRYIYIHGCPEQYSFSEPSSIGCIRMKNNDLLELYEKITINDHVYISPHKIVLTPV